ncbi:MAG: RNA polymerase sigma factor RpoD/SigA [Verrucomicrobiota bacterium]
MKLDDQEGALATYLEEIRVIPLLTHKEVIKLSKRLQRGDSKARETLIKGNLRLVIKIANQYSGLGLPVLDLISEGNMGLMKAADRFDPEVGARFSTYAAWWIKQAIKRALSNQSKTIRLPIHVVEKLAKMRRLSMHLADELGRDPTDEELSEELKISLRKLTHLKRVSTSTVSLNAVLGEDHANEIGETIEDENAEDPYLVLMQDNLNEVASSVWDELNVREKTILSLRFPASGEKVMTLDKIGERLSITRERVRQLQNQALLKLREAIEKKDSSLRLAW